MAKSSSKNKQQESSAKESKSIFYYIVPLLKYCGILLILIFIIHNVLFAPDLAPVHSSTAQDTLKGSNDPSSSSSFSSSSSSMFEPSESKAESSSSSPTTQNKIYDPFAHMRETMTKAQSQTQGKNYNESPASRGGLDVKTLHDRLGTTAKEDDPLPEIVWGKEGVTNISIIPITEDHLEGSFDLLPDPLLDRHCYTLGSKLDKHCVYTPMCIDPLKKSFILPTGGSGPKCSGFNRARQWLDDHCELIESILWQEAYFQAPIMRKPMAWLQEQKHEQDVQWIDGLTLFQTLEASCTNVTDFAYRIMYLNHILNNDQSYDYGHVDRVLLFPDSEVLKRFAKPAQYGSWHRSVFDAVIAPSITTTPNDALNLPIDGKIRFNAFVQSDIFDMAASTKPGVTNRLMCFNRVVIASFFRERFFVLDNEYKSEESKMGTIAPDNPSVPKDAWKFRRRLAQVFKKTSGPNGYPIMRKRLVYLHRNTNYRVFSPSTLAMLMRMITRYANQNKFAMEVMSIEGLPVAQIYDLFSETAIFVSIHSHHLANIIFAPPLSCLIEIFPYKYKSEVFVEGGFSGIKYYAVRVSMGLEWSKATDSGITDSEECQEKIPECFAYYRDQNLSLARADYLRIRDVLSDAFYSLKVIEKEHADHLAKAKG